ncbi:hypothetical protein L204_103877 [Cryptococcus depauperatus]
MDERLLFLRHRLKKDEVLPLECSFVGTAGQTELHYWPPKPSTHDCPKHLLLFILGNPGLLGYYPPFLNHLHSLLPPAHAILATSHIGHSVTIPGPSIPLSLDQQIGSKVEIVEAIRRCLDGWADDEGSPKPKFALMGHSVGAYMTCEVIKRVNKPGHEWPIHSGYLLFPTLGWIANTWNGWTLWPIFHRPIRPILPYIAPLLRPFHSLVSLPPTSRSLLNSPSVLQHVLSLSKDEMISIRDLDEGWFKSQGLNNTNAGNGLYGIWSAGNQDGWVGRDGPLVQEYLGKEESGRVKVLSGVPHAFCVTQQHSELVAEIVAGWINPNLSLEKVSALIAIEPIEQLPTSSVIPM